MESEETWKRTLHQGCRAVGRGLYGKAIALFRQVSLQAEDPVLRTEAALRAGIARELRGEGRIAEDTIVKAIQALNGCEKALEYIPGEVRAEAFWVVGCAFSMRDEFGEAEGYLRRALDARTKSSSSIRALAESNLACILMTKGQAAEAKALYTSSIPVLERGGFAVYDSQHGLIKSLLACGDLVDAEAALGKLMAFHPPPSRMAEFLGTASKVAAGVGDLELASEYLSEAAWYLDNMTDSEKRSGTQLNLATIAFNSRLYGIALDLAKSLTRTDSGVMKDARELYAQTLYMMKNFPECLEFSMMALEEAPWSASHAAIMCKMGLLAAEQMRRWDVVKSLSATTEQRGLGSVDEELRDLVSELRRGGAEG